MSNRDTTLSDLCKLNAEKFKDAPGPAAFLKAQREQLKITTVPWPKVEEKIVEKIAGLLDIKLLDIWLAAWKKCHELQQFAEHQKYSKEEPIPVRLVEHEIVSEHHPVLEIDVAGLVVQRLTFDLVATLELTGCELTIQGGRIKEVLVGKYKGVVTLEWNKLQITKVETDEVRFGEPIPLGEGIPLASAEVENAFTQSGNEFQLRSSGSEHESVPSRARRSEPKVPRQKPKNG